MTRQQDLLAGFALLAVWALMTLYRHWGLWGTDMSALYWASHFYGLGQLDQIYVGDENFFWDDPPGLWLELAKSFSAPKLNITPYIYPPLWAAIFAPLTKIMGPHGFFNMMQCINVVSMCGSVWLAWRMWGSQRTPFLMWVTISVALLMITMPAVLALQLNQPQIFVTFVTLLAFWAMSTGHSKSAGGILALAAAIKLSPAALVLIFLMRRDWVGIASFAIFGAALAGLSIAVSGFDLHWQLLERISLLDGKILVSRINYSIEPFFYQLIELIQGRADFFISNYRIFDQPFWMGPVVKLKLVLGFVLVWWITHSHPEPRRLWLQIILLAPILMILSPLAWVHYLLLPLFLLPGIFVLLPLRTAIIVLVLVIVAFSDSLWQQLVWSQMTVWAPMLVGFTSIVICIKTLSFWALRHRN